MARASGWRRLAVVLLAIAAASLSSGVALAQDNLIWNPAAGATGSDGSGAWNTLNKLWYDQSNSSETAYPGTGTYANVTIGDGGTLSTTNDTITMGSSIAVGNITFNSVSGGAYQILDTSGTATAAPSDPLVLSDATTTITDNNTAGQTNIQAALTSANSFTLNILGTGSLGFGGSIGTTAAPATLQVGGSSNNGYSGTIVLAGANKLAATTIGNGATLRITNNSALGPSSAPVALAGGTLVLSQGAIGVNLDGGQSGSNYPYNPITSTIPSGAYPIQNWNNFQITGKPPAPTNSSQYGSPLADSSGVPTNASVTAVGGNNTYGIGSSSSALSGNQQLLFGGANAGGTSASVTISNIPYSSYSVYAYAFGNNSSTAASNLTLTATNQSNSPFYFEIAAAAKNSNNAPSQYLEAIAAASTSSNPTLDTEGQDGLYEGMYAQWTGQTGATATVTLNQGSTSTNPWLAGVEIVAAPISISNAVSVASSSTINLGSYLTVPQLAGGLTIAGGSTLSITGSSGSQLYVDSATNFTAAGGTISPASGVVLQLAGITDGGFGFNTAGAGLVLLTSNNSATATGPVVLGGTTQLSMSSSSSGSATGSGNVKIAGAATIPATLSVPVGTGYTGNGIITPGSSHSVTVSTYGSVIGPAAGGTLNLAGTVNIAGGTVTGGAGTLFLGGTSGGVNVNSGGTLTTGIGAMTLGGMMTVNGNATVNIGLNGTAPETITASGGLTLAGGTSTYLLSASGTGVSGIINAADGSTVPDLLVTGSHTIDPYFGAGALLQINTTYNLIEYSAAAPIVTTGGNNSPLVFTGLGQGGSIAIASSGQGALPATYQYQLVDNISAGTNAYYVQLQLTAPNLVWTGAVNSNWDSGTNATANWADGTTATIYSDGSIVQFADTNPITGTTITANNIAITVATVSPGGIIFNNNLVNYTIGGSGAIAGSGAITLSGIGSVTLTGSNTFSGAVAINAGELDLENSRALGGSSGVGVASGGALALQNGISIGSIPLSIDGTGWTTTPAGALDSISGANSYAGAITLAGAATINSAHSGDTLTLAGGIVDGTNNLTLSGAGNIKIMTTGISGGGSMTYGGAGTLTLATADTLSGPIDVSSGTLLLTNAGALGSASGATVSSGAAMNVQGGIALAAVPLSIAGEGLSTSQTGVLDNVSGNNSFAGAITLSAAASIGSSKSNNTLTLSGGINTGSNALTLIGVGNTTVAGSISGSGGSVVYSGSGILRLSANNTFTGGTTVDSGTLIAGAGSLGAAGVTMNGGTLGFASAAIGMHVASYFSSNTYNTISAGTSAGVVPIANWNNLNINHAAQAPIASGAAGDTPLPFVLNNSSGVVTTANLVSWAGNNGYGNTAGSNGVTELLSSGLNTNADPNDGATLGINPATIAIGNIPYSTYDVYIYYWNDVAGTIGSMSLSSGPSTSSLTANPTTFYFNTGGGSNPTSYLLGSTNSATPMTNADYAVWTGVSGGTLEATEVGLSSATPWIAGIEIVADSMTYSNPVKLTASATIDVTGVKSVTMGTLTVLNGSTLSVTGGSDTGADAYSLNFGAVSLSSSATFNVANNKNGSGAGALNLGSISDGSAGYSVTLTGPGTVGLISTTGSTYTGGTNITAGTLQLYDMGSNSSDSATGSKPVAVSGSGALAGPTNIGGNAYIAGAVSVTAGASVRATSGASLYLQQGLSLANGSAATFLFAGAAANGTGGPAMIVTSGASPTSLSIGAAMGDTVTINFSGTPVLSSATETYDLLSYTGTALSATASNNNQTLTFSNGASLTIGTLPSGPVTAVELVNNPAMRQIDLEYTVAAESWTGDSSGNWDTTTASTNWAIGPLHAATAVSFGNPAAVTFSDIDNTTGNGVNNTTIAIQSGGVQPNSVVFSNSAATYTFSNATNPATGVDDTTGIAGSTGISINGGGGVAFTDGNTFTGAVQIAAGYLQTYSNATPSANYSLSVNGLGSASSVTVAAGAELQLGSLSDSGNPYTYGSAASGASTIPLTIAGTGSSRIGSGNGSGNGIGALSSAGGINSYEGSITLAGNATINSNSANIPDQLILSGGINTAAHALTFNGPGATAVSSAISGTGGSVTNTGGTLTLAGANSYSAGTTITGGAVQVASNTALGSGPVYLQGGNLDFIQGNGIGLNVASNGASPLTNPPPADFSVNSVTPNEAVGALQSFNWNNLTVVHNANSATNVGSPAPSGGNTPAGSTVAPVALNDSTGMASGASLTAWSGSTGYSAQPSSNGTLQMISSWLLASNNQNASITISNIPYATYSVYVYFDNNYSTYGETSISTSSISYYYETYGSSPPAVLTQNTTSNNPGSYAGGYQQSDYAVWTGQTGSTLTATLSEVPVSGDGTSGMSGIEIVNDSVTITNSLNVSADSAIDVTGPSSVTVGALSIGANALTVTGGSTGANTPYTLTTGAVTLSGNATFNVADNGYASGTLSLGTISDAGHGDGININSNGSGGIVLLSNGGSYTGTTNVEAGTLEVVGNLVGNGGVIVSSSAALAGSLTTGSATIAGPVTLAGTIVAVGGNPLSLTGGLTLQNDSSSVFELPSTPNGASGTALIATSGAGPTSLVIDGNHSIYIFGTPDGTPGSYTYELFSYTGTPLSAIGNGNSTLAYAGGNLSLIYAPSGPYTFALSNNPASNQIDLTVTTFGFTWNGTSGGTWNTTSYNWQSLSGSNVNSSKYASGGSVLFTDYNLDGTLVSNGSGVATVNVQSGGVTPSVVAFSNVGAAQGGVDYLVAGGAIGGASTSLNMSGAGNVTLENNNTYGGGTFITSGALTTTAGGKIGPGALVLSAIGGVTATANLGTSQSVSSITNTAAAGGATQLTVAQGATITSTGPLTNTGTLNLNVGGQSGGTLMIQSAPVLNAGSNIQVNAGTLEFNVSGGSPATVQAGVSVTVASAAVLQLAGSVSALSSAPSGGSTAASIINNGTLTVTNASTQTVGVVSGISSTNSGGQEVFAGTTIVGDGSNAATLSVTAILQNALIVNADSIVTIEPESASGGGGADAASAVVSGGNAQSQTESASIADSTSGSNLQAASDPFPAIEAVLASGASLTQTMLGLKQLTFADHLRLSPSDDLLLMQDYATLAAGDTINPAGNSNLAALLVNDLAEDGLGASEIAALTGIGGSSVPSFGNIVGNTVSSSIAADEASGTAAVPEPSALVLAAMALIAVGARLRRCQRA